VTYEEAKKKIDTDPDFVYSKRFGFSLEKVLDKYPDGAENKVIAQCLLMTEDEVEETLASVVQKLRLAMKVE
jgi:hypothetical protein